MKSRIFFIKILITDDIEEWDIGDVAVFNIVAVEATDLNDTVCTFQPATIKVM